MGGLLSRVPVRTALAITAYLRLIKGSIRRASSQQKVAPVVTDSQDEPPRSVGVEVL
jgi:hypothetical protein